MNEVRLESLEQTIKTLKKKNRNLGSVIAILILVILGLILYTYLTKSNEVVCQEPSSKEKEEVKENIVIDENLIKDLRELIPRVEKCNTYYHEQYSSNKFTKNDEIKEYNSCDDYMTINYLYDHSDSSIDEVYIYDYVLIRNSNNSTSNLIYGSTYDNMKYSYNDIMGDNDSISDEILKSKGAKYKYTFKLNDDKKYNYISTELIKED